MSLELGLQDRLVELDDKLSQFEESFAKMLEVASKERQERLSQLEAAKLRTALAYSLNALYFGSQTRPGGRSRDHAPPSMALWRSVHADAGSGPDGAPSHGGAGALAA